MQCRAVVAEWIWVGAFFWLYLSCFWVLFLPDVRMARCEVVMVMEMKGDGHCERALQGGGRCARKDDLKDRFPSTLRFAPSHLRAKRHLTAWQGGAILACCAGRQGWEHQES